MSRTIDETAVEVAKAYLSSISPTNPPPVSDIKADIIDQTAAVFEIENTQRPKGQNWPIKHELYPIQIAMVISALYEVRRIAMGGLDVEPEYDILAVYQTDGYNKGLYVGDENALERLVCEFNCCAKPKEIKDVIYFIRMWAERVERTQNENLIPMGNGVFDYASRQLLPFSPNYVFTVKSHVDYNPAAQNVIIHNPDDNTDWDVETWLSELSDDPEIVELLWCVISAVLRPNVAWDKSIWLYSEVGNNGKGTLCELLRALLGKGAYTSLGISDFSQEFMLEGLTSVSAVITDENDVGTYIDKAAKLKAIITGDVVQINRKFKTPIAIRFNGLIIECVNEIPRTRDRSESLYRRLLVIPFEKSFTGAERKYIKHDYIKREEVLEYVAYKALNMDCRELPVPERCAQALGQYKLGNDPVRQFLNDVLPELQWNVVPHKYLYSLYKAWFKEYIPSGTVEANHTFKRNVEMALRNSNEWYYMRSTDGAIPISEEPEPMTIKYELKEWYNPHYTGNDPDKIAIPPSGSYRGLKRLNNRGRLYDN